ncbi:Na/Pi symporter [Bacillus benzoevorans]|uniref:Phosphate:Na+ symporter n=1 Tax=Bacillus benzoevorans TaxID=1456 RepID=A0A7X0HT60_9BACI|nr:phosphate:Na+ symporter [Bacillus benzoevorans]
MVLLLFILLIGLFILGMSILRRGLFHLSGDALKEWLAKFTDATWKSFLAGILITCILQSSSAVMIITIGLIAAKMLTFSQSIGIILGTNIGTTITTELITFDIESFIIPITILALILLFIPRGKVQSFGMILLGISFIFMAMNGFGRLAIPLKQLGIIDMLLLTLDNSYIWSILTGTIITGIIQSSTATVGIIMGFLSSESMDIDTGVAIMLGSNIGTCVDAFIAAIGSGREARLTAYAHIWLNVLGVLIFFPFIEWLSKTGAMLAETADVQLAHISLLFNVICSLVVLPFANAFGKLILLIHDN